MIIPAIEDIVAGLITGEASEEQALTWLQQHVDNTDLRELRDGMAMAAMEGIAGRSSADGVRAAFVSGIDADDIAASAYRIADAMMKARAQ